MNASQRAGSVEFLQFLADISNPVTGEISADRLATWLCQTESGLYELWHRRDGIPWASFADEVLSVLDAIQDQTCDMEATVEWYLHQPLDNFDKNTPQQLVAMGMARRLVAAIKAQGISFLGGSVPTGNRSDCR